MHSPQELIRLHRQGEGSRIIARRVDRARRLHTTRVELMGPTPVELDRIAHRAEDLASRDRFHTEMCEGWRRLALAPLDARAQRKSPREAI